MSLITVCQDVAADVGISTPTIVAAATEPEHVELLAFANAVAEEIAARVDWGVLTATATITGDGTSAAQTVNAAMRKVVDGAAVFTSGGVPIRPLSYGEWPVSSVEGTPRFFLLQGKTIRFWPHLASAATATVRYVSLNWCSNGTAAFVSDSDTTLFPEDVLTLGLIAHWRRQKGMPYQDQEAAYEARLAQYAADDDRRRFE